MFRDLFSEGSAAYASCRPGYPPELVDWLAEVAPGRERAWDSGCGSGQLAVRLAQRFAQVVATDASAAQLAHARPHARVRYRRAPAEASGLPPASVDLAAAAQAAHWFDLPRYWDEVRRVGRPRAVVAVVTYGLARVAPGIDERVSRFYHDEVGRCWPPERRLAEDGYRSVEFPFDELEAPALDMRERWTADAFIGYVGTWSAVHALARAEGRAPFVAFAGELRERWGQEARDVRWPIALRAGRLPG